MIEEAPSIQMPPRSRLYNLPMSGSCGATQESILDYAQRLSAKHHVSPRRMFTDIYLPEAGRSHLASGPGKLCPKVVYSANGASDLARDFTAGLQRLTGRTDLIAGTLLPWRKLLGTKSSFNTNRHWCPRCLMDQGDVEHHAFSLLWTLTAATSCPVHRILLATSCGSCGKAQPRIHGEGALRQCAHCQHSLASELNVVPAVADARSLHISGALAEMIALGSEATELAKPETFWLQFEQAVAKHFNGSQHRFARELGMSRQLGRGKASIGLNSLLELTHRLSTTPVEAPRVSWRPVGLSQAAAVAV